MPTQKKKPYCSIGEVPKGQKRGSMKECADMKQIRYYGVKKIDSRTLEYSTNGHKKISKKLTGKRTTTDAQISKELAHARGKWAEFKRRIRDMDTSSLTENQKKKLRMEQTVLKNLLIVAEHKAVVHKENKAIAEITKKVSRKQSRTSKKGTRKTKRSTKKKSSRKLSRSTSKTGKRRSKTSKRKSKKN